MKCGFGVWGQGLGPVGFAYKYMKSTSVKVWGLGGNFRVGGSGCRV